MKIKNILLVIFSFLLVTSCINLKSTSSVPQRSIHEIIDDAETILVDVRVKEDFDIKTVDGAINIPLAELTNNLEFLEKQKSIVVFCNRGRQSDLAIDLLRKKGFKNIYDGTTMRNVSAIKDQNQKNKK